MKAGRKTVNDLRKALGLAAARLCHGMADAIGRTAEAVFRKVRGGALPGRGRLSPESRDYLVKAPGVRSDGALRGGGGCRGMEHSPPGPGAAWFRHRGFFDKLVAGFGKWPGRTLLDRIEAYALPRGLPADGLARFRATMPE